MQANGIVGEVDMFTDKPDEPLTLPTDAFSFGGLDPTTNLFPTVPLTYSGKRHRANLHGFNASATYNVSKYIGVKFEMSGNYRSNEIQTGNVILTFPCNYPNFPVGGCNQIPVAASYPPNTIRTVIPFASVETGTNQKHYNYLGGIQIKNNSKEKRFKPFAHIMAGVSQQTVKFKNFTDNGNTFDRANDPRKIYGLDKLTNTGFTMQFGGGLDIRLNKKMDIRVVQFDYNPVKINEKQIIAFRQAITGINIPNNLTFLNTASPGFTLYSTHDMKVTSRWQSNIRIGFGIVFH